MGWCQGFYRRWLKVWEIRLCAGLAVCSLMGIVVACPFLLDPAVMTLLTVYEEANCVTVGSAFRVGVSNCSWTSCRKGCTSEANYNCWHVYVNYTLARGIVAEDADSPSANVSTLPSFWQKARLLVNTQACGYEPRVDCLEFSQEYGVVGKNFTCWVNRDNATIAVPYPGYDYALDDVSVALIPLGIFCLVMAHLFLRRGLCDCRTLTPDAVKQHKAKIAHKVRQRQKLINKLKRLQEAEEAEYGSSKGGSFFMPRRSRSKRKHHGGGSTDDSASISSSASGGRGPGTIELTTPERSSPESTPAVEKKRYQNGGTAANRNLSTAVTVAPVASTSRGAHQLRPSEFSTQGIDGTSTPKSKLSQSANKRATGLPGAIDIDDDSDFSIDFDDPALKV